MLDAFKLKEFDLEPVFESWKNPPRFLGNPKKDSPVDTWLDQVKEGCLERKIPKEYWHKVGQRFLGDKARKRLDELKEVLRNLHGGNYRWDWKKFKTAMRNMGWDVDDEKTESVRVQTKSSGSWWIIGREKEEVSEEPIETKQTEKKKPVPMRRATVGESSPTTDKPQPEKSKTETETEKPAPKRRGTWLVRSPSNASISSATPAENSKEVVKAEPASSSGFWKLPFPSSSSNPTTAPSATTPAPALAPAATTTTTTTAVVPTSAAPQGEVTTTEAQAPVWLLNACNALDFLTSEHPKVMSTLSAVLITVGTLPALPGISAGAGGAILASHAVQAAGAIAVGVGHWLKSAQDSTAPKVGEAAAQASGQIATIEDVSNRR
ncbi:hypothetical protein F5888DRAFT_1714348 [Russula emetica]|nr:hypothetical protein F5888DRAFT_1714348 [Russula emetica]